MACSARRRRTFDAIRRRSRVSSAERRRVTNRTVGAHQAPSLRLLRRTPLRAYSGSMWKAWPALVFLGIVITAGCSSDKGKCRDKGFKVCKQRCDDGDMNACAETGEFLFVGTSEDKAGMPVAEDAVAAITYFDKACKAGVDDGCIGQAYAYITGTGARADINRAIAIADPVCTKGRGKACGLLVRAATAAGLDPAPARARAVEAYRRECEANRGGAAGRDPCWALATEGWLPIDEAMKYAQITCDRGREDFMCKDKEKMKAFLLGRQQH